MSTDVGGLLLLREGAERAGLLRRFAGCFTDHREPGLIEHSVAELVAQRVLAQACGYEDLNDHDVLRDDALLAVAAGQIARTKHLVDGTPRYQNFPAPRTFPTKFWTPYIRAGGFATAT